MVERKDETADAGHADHPDLADRAAPPLWQFCHLPFGYQMLIWAVRMWLRSAGAPAARWTTIREAFAKINAEDATVPFLRLMTVMHAGARVPILIGEGGCAVFPDEIRLAEVLARAVDGDAETGRRHLERVLAPAAARVAGALVRDIACMLRDAGLRFPRVSVSSEAPQTGDTMH
jgi:hypothetical protein